MINYIFLLFFRFAVAYLNIGIVLSKQGKNDDALKFYRRCADLDTSGSKDPKLHLSTKISALFNMGRLLTEQNRLKVSFLIRMRRKKVKLLFYLMNIQEALDVYSEALKRRPDDYAPQSIYNMIGKITLILSQFTPFKFSKNIFLLMSISIFCSSRKKFSPLIFLFILLCLKFIDLIKLAEEKLNACLKKSYFFLILD